MSQQTYSMPESVEEALEIAQQHPQDYMYLAGGTDVQIDRQQGHAKHRHLIDLTAITALYGIDCEENTLHIGALVTLDDLMSSPHIAAQAPLLVTAAQTVATPVIRKTATVGGNLLVKNRCVYYNQSEDWRTAVGSCLRDDGDICLVTRSQPHCYARNVSDLAPALIVLDAQITIRNRHATGVIPLIDLYTSSGMHPHHHLDGDGILSRISVPLRPVQSWFRKLRLRRSLDFTSLTMAAAVDEAGYARVCVNGMSMAPALFQGPVADLTLDTLQGQARKACQTVENDLLPLKYRRAMLAVYLEEWWDTISFCSGT